MRRTILSYIAFLFVYVLIGAYLHFYSMLFVPGAPCSDGGSAHSECIVAISGFAPAQSHTQVMDVLVLLAFVFSFCLATLSLYIISHLRGNARVAFFVELFRRGLLHPKAP